MRAGVGWNAEDPKRGMTFRELREIVQQAMRVGVSDDALVRVKVGWGGQTQQLRVEETEER
jgi:hypothetical protein